VRVYRHDFYVTVNSRPVAPSTLRVVQEPDRYQISNYNSQPMLCVEVLSKIEANMVMRAELVEETTQRIIPMGFKAGDAQPVLPASK
jgi:hypothetical protein